MEQCTHTYTNMVGIYKPEFVRHDAGAPIFSVDCHPDGTRIATAGGDQKVKVWSLAPILKDKDRSDVENDPSAPKCLATLGGAVRLLGAAWVAAFGKTAQGRPRLESAWFQKFT